MDISLSKKIDQDLLRSITAEFCAIDEVNIIVTDGMGQILDDTASIKPIWINLVTSHFGDFKIKMEIYAKEEGFGSFVSYAKFLAQKTNQSILSDFNKELKYAQWILIDQQGNDFIVEEDLTIDYPEGEDGITIAASFRAHLL